MSADGGRQPVASEHPDRPDVVEIAEMFGTVARELLNQRDVDSTLQRIVQLAVEHLDGCESAGISMVVGRVISSPASSGDIALALDRIQQEVDEGPCLDALREHQIYKTGHLDHEPRWVAFSHRAHAETGVMSILSIRLFIEHDTLGSLNLYSTAADAFNDTAVALGAVFATHAAVALSSARLRANLERKAASRDLIGRAKGILMTQQHVSDERAFELLRAASQRLNIKVTEVADAVTFTGELPD